MPIEIMLNCILSNTGLCVLVHHPLLYFTFNSPTEAIKRVCYGFTDPFHEVKRKRDRKKEVKLFRAM